MGLKHLFDHEYFLPMMPKAIPQHKLLIYISGVCEIILGCSLLLPSLRIYAAYGIMILLTLIFPANIYVSINNIARKQMKISRRGSIIRLFFQPVLILIAYWHSF
ncbi:MAG: DoxX-like family protein [Flavobacteriales bacterium]|nr:DoxX-like family protein [Flavobacteriales bacterium]